MPGTVRGPPQWRDLHFHSTATLRAKTWRFHRQTLLAAAVGVRRRFITAVVAVTAAVPAELL
ncbi:hypothetical protein [Paenarthrobacter sp.]|uniref:hypothetical protein n=1 Tax=Paenarthrobacter sp. TaxID=1931993 RepID=UPI002811A31A|nr:hypothetical protein [Paenarthrobacter sp.]